MFKIERCMLSEVYNYHVLSSTLNIELSTLSVFSSFTNFAAKHPTISFTSDILSNPIEYLKGVGPQRADLLKKELSIFTFSDLLQHFPYRHVDKTKVNAIRDINFQTEFIQVAG